MGGISSLFGGSSKQSSAERDALRQQSQLAQQQSAMLAQQQQQLAEQQAKLDAEAQAQSDAAARAEALKQQQAARASGSMLSDDDTTAPGIRTMLGVI